MNEIIYYQDGVFAQSQLNTSADSSIEILDDNINAEQYSDSEINNILDLDNDQLKITSKFTRKQTQAKTNTFSGPITQVAPITPITCVRRHFDAALFYQLIMSSVVFKQLRSDFLGDQSRSPMHCKITECLDGILNDDNSRWERLSCRLGLLVCFLFIVGLYLWFPCLILGVYLLWYLVLLNRLCTELIKSVDNFTAYHTQMSITIKRIKEYNLNKDHSSADELTTLLIKLHSEIIEVHLEDHCQQYVQDLTKLYNEAQVSLCLFFQTILVSKYFTDLSKCLKKLAQISQVCATAQTTLKVQTDRKVILKQLTYFKIENEIESMSIQERLGSKMCALGSKLGQGVTADVKEEWLLVQSMMEKLCESKQYAELKPFIQKEVEEVEMQGVAENKEQKIQVKTEVFDDFTEINYKDEISIKKPEVMGAADQPPFQFVNELKQRLKQRAEELEQQDVEFREFDTKTGHFISISKQERVKKIAEFQSKTKNEDQKSIRKNVLAPQNVSFAQFFKQVNSHQDDDVFN